MNTKQNISNDGMTIATKSVKPKRKLSGQYVAFLIHSFFGLKLTLLLTLVLASGTLAVFAKEIDWLIFSEMRVTPYDTRLSEGELMDKLQAAYPERGLSNFSPNSHFPYTAASATFNDDAGGFRTAWIDPYTGEVKGDTPLLTIGTFLSFLHASLFLPVIGRSLVNAFGIFTMISLIAGLIAVPKFWRYFLRTPRTNNIRAFLSDAHKIVGVWSIWFLLVMGVTGTWWFYKNPLVSYAGAPQLHEPYARKPILDYAELDKFGSLAPRALSAEQIAQVVKEAYPDLKITALTPPEHNADPYTVTGSLGEWLVGERANRIWINPFDGSIISKDMVSDNTFMQRFDRSMRPIHYGTWAVSGLSDLLVKTIWFIFGLLMTGLALSGLVLNYKRTKRSARIVVNRSQIGRRFIKSLHIIKPWGGPMGVFKYLNIIMLAGVGLGTGVVITLASQGVNGSGFEYTTKPLGPWEVKVNAIAGLLEKDLPPIRDGANTNLNVTLSKEAVDSIKFIYARVGKPRNLRAPGTLIHGPVGFKHAHYKLPRKIHDNAELWITAVTWSGEVYQTSWSLMPDGKETIDVR